MEGLGYTTIIELAEPPAGRRGSALDRSAASPIGERVAFMTNKQIAKSIREQADKLDDISEKTQRIGQPVKPEPKAASRQLADEVDYEEPQPKRVGSDVPRHPACSKEEFVQRELAALKGKEQSAHREGREKQKRK